MAEAVRYIPAPPPPPPQKIRLELSEEEAQLVVLLCGSGVGGGKYRKMSDGVYTALRAVVKPLVSSEVFEPGQNTVRFREIL